MILYLRVLRGQVAEFIAREADARESRDDAVHAMRVTTRRLRSCLKTFGGAFVEEPTRRLSVELRWFGGRLGAERDAEVIDMRIVGELNELDAELILGPVREILVTRAQAEITEAHQGLIEAMNSQRYRSLLGELVAFADRPPFRSRPRQKSWLERQFSKSVRRTNRLVRQAATLQGTEHDLALHEVRKSAKHVRYAAETLQMFGGQFSRVRRRFALLQEILGEHHDATVARRFFREEGTRAGLRPGEDGFTYGLLLGHEEARAAAAEAAFGPAWRRARRSVRSIHLTR